MRRKEYNFSEEQKNKLEEIIDDSCKRFEEAAVVFYMKNGKLCMSEVMWGKESWLLSGVTESEVWKRAGWSVDTRHLYNRYNDVVGTFHTHPKFSPYPSLPQDVISPVDWQCQFFCIGGVLRNHYAICCYNIPEYVLSLVREVREYERKSREEKYNPDVGQKIWDLNEDIMTYCKRFKRDRPSYTIMLCKEKHWEKGQWV